MTMSRSGRNNRTAVFILTSLTLAAHVTLEAQGVQASVSGTVTDESGSVVPGVTVTMVNKATNDSRTVVTDERGAYRFDGLRPSKYSLSGELQGFTTVTHEELTVNVGGALTIDLQLKVSALNETVT